MRAVREGDDRSARSCRPGEGALREFRAEYGAGDEGSELRAITLGDPLVDAYLEFVGARGAVNTWLATAYDLKVFFEVVGKDPAEVTSADVFTFLAAQRTPRREKVVRIEDGEAGLSARTIARRLSSVAGLFEYLLVRGDAGVDRNPVPRGLAGRRAGQRGRGGVRLVRRPRTLPRVLSPVEVDRLLGALRTQRDRAIVLAMLLAGLRRCEVLGLGLRDINPGEQRLFVASGKGVRERIVPVSGRFFEALGEYLVSERPSEVPTDACFVVLKGPRRGMPLTTAGLDEVIDGVGGRAGLPRLTCHMLRHTCLTRLREQGMSLEALQAQAGHASIDSPASICTWRTTGSGASICGRRRRSRRRSTRPRGRRHSGPACARPGGRGADRRLSVGAGRGRSFRRERGDLAGPGVPFAGRWRRRLVAPVGRGAVAGLGGARERGGDVDDRCRPRAAEAGVSSARLSADWEGLGLGTPRVP